MGYQGSEATLVDKERVRRSTTRTRRVERIMEGTLMLILHVLGTILRRSGARACWDYSRQGWVSPPLSAMRRETNEDDCPSQPVKTKEY